MQRRLSQALDNKYGSGKRKTHWNYITIVCTCMCVHDQENFNLCYTESLLPEIHSHYTPYTHTLTHVHAHIHTNTLIRTHTHTPTHKDGATNLRWSKFFFTLYIIIISSEEWCKSENNCTIHSDLDAETENNSELNQTKIQCFGSWWNMPTQHLSFHILSEWILELIQVPIFWLASPKSPVYYIYSYGST